MLCFIISKTLPDFLIRNFPKIEDTTFLNLCRKRSQKKEAGRSNYQYLFHERFNIYILCSFAQSDRISGPCCCFLPSFHFPTNFSFIYLTFFVGTYTPSTYFPRRMYSVVRLSDIRSQEYANPVLPLLTCDSLYHI